MLNPERTKKEDEIDCLREDEIDCLRRAACTS